MGFSFAKRANFVDEIIFVSVFASLVLTSHAQLLPEEEVEVLRTISSKLQNTYWPYVNRSSCSGGFNYTEVADDIYSGVWCDCSFNSSTVCHVARIQMKGLSLGGTLAKEFANLTYLRELDFSRNYLNGSIPAEFGKLPLVNFSLIGNRISGIIPVEIGDITTLEVLVLEDNLLEGNLPQNLGSLSNLKRLLLAANNFNGTIPATFGKLRNLTDFRIDGSSMTGKIPDFIGNWTQLTRLNMQGTSMEGPIPASISVLKNLTDLRISDLKGPVMSFPNLQNMTSLQFLYLKNCSIVDTIPPYLKDFTNLDVLDLSFNSLTGEIGESIQPGKLRYLFLSDNLLTGAIPAWILSSRYNIDVSYNNFTQFPSVNCQFPNV